MKIYLTIIFVGFFSVLSGATEAPKLIINYEALEVLNQKAQQLLPFDYSIIESKSEHEASVMLMTRINEQSRNAEFMGELAQLTNEVHSFFSTGQVLAGTTQDQVEVPLRDLTQLHPLILVLSRSVVISSFEFLSKGLATYSGNTKFMIGIAGLLTFGAAFTLQRPLREKHARQQVMLDLASKCAQQQLMMGASQMDHCTDDRLTKMITAFRSIFAGTYFTDFLRQQNSKAVHGTFRSANFVMTGRSHQPLQTIGVDEVHDLWERLLYNGAFMNLGFLQSLNHDLREIAKTHPIEKSTIEVRSEYEN